MGKPAIILTSPEELRQARLNQPRVSLEYLRKQRERHRLASEAFAKAARSATSKAGRAKAACG
jgi:hypothetical protein